jgi:NADH:ubiquinone oxidoreductase subunit K
MAQVPVTWYLYVSAALFSIGLFGMMTRRNAIALLMSIELMLNAANINLVAFSSYLKPMIVSLSGKPVNYALSGQIFALFVITIAAAEAAVGLAIIINVYRTVRHINADEINLMKW